jgi:hypothetical protein
LATVTTQTTLAPGKNHEFLTSISNFFERPQTRRMMLGATTALYLICCFSLALTRAPWYDEGFVVNASYAWITTGHPGMSILDDSGPFLPFPQRISLKGIREHLYAQMPLHTVFLAAWFKTLGFGLVRARILTIACGLVILFCLYSIVRRLTTDAAVAFAAFALTAIDYGFVLRTSEARMDAMSAAFGFGGLAVYLTLRERSFAQAMLWSHACVAASAFTHPNGGMLAFAGLAFLTLSLDPQRIQFRHIVIAVSPYLVAAACWGIYITRDVSAFKSQFLLNAMQGGRLRTFAAPLQNLRREILERYLGSLGGAGDFSGFKRFKLIIPISYFAGLAAVTLVPSLRRRKGYFVLLALTLIYFFVLAFTDGRKSQCYTVHVIPLYATLLAAGLVALWRMDRGYRGATAATVLLLCTIHLGGIFFQAHADTYHRSYLPAIHFLQTNVSADQSIVGPGMLGFGLCYPPNLTDDFRLGSISGQTPEWIVVNDWYRAWFRVMGGVEPDAYQFVRNRLNHEYALEYDQAGMEIYRRR